MKKYKKAPRWGAFFMMVLCKCARCGHLGVKCRCKILVFYLLQLRHGNGGGVLHLHFIGAHPQRRVQV